MNWLPKHECGLYLTHNEHRDMYETIEEYYDCHDFVSPEELKKAIAEDSVWVLQWYPDTPIGSYSILASSLEALEASIKEMEA
jgi:hypothetical protein